MKFTATQCIVQPRRGQNKNLMPTTERHTITTITCEPASVKCQTLKNKGSIIELDLRQETHLIRVHYYTWIEGSKIDLLSIQVVLSQHDASSQNPWKYYHGFHIWMIWIIQNEFHSIKWFIFKFYFNRSLPLRRIECTKTNMISKIWYIVNVILKCSTFQWSQLLLK